MPRSELSDKTLFAPASFHPKMVAQLKKEGLIPQSAPAPVVKGGGGVSLKSERKKIAEDKPKNKVVLDYFEKVIAAYTGDSSDEED
jgi:hypothetical protein